MPADDDSYQQGHGDHAQKPPAPHRVRARHCHFRGDRYLWHPADRRQKAISPAGHGFDESGVFGRVAQRIPQPSDCGVDAVLEINKGVIGPQPPAQFFPRHHLARTLQQCQKDCKGWSCSLTLTPLRRSSPVFRSTANTPKRRVSGTPAGRLLASDMPCSLALAEPHIDRYLARYLFDVTHPYLVTQI